MLTERQINAIRTLAEARIASGVNLPTEAGLLSFIAGKRAAARLVVSAARLRQTRLLPDERVFYPAHHDLTLGLLTMYRKHILAARFELRALRARAGGVRAAA